MTPPQSTPRLNGLALRISEPDTGALATYRAGLRLMALRALGDSDTAEDVAQETLSRALVAIRTGDHRIEHLGAFIHGIARHVIADVLRGRERVVDASVIDCPATPGADPLLAAISAEERTHMHDALAKLSSTDRALLRLSFFEGLKPGEVARRLGAPVLLIRKRKSRAMERLRRIFLASGHDSPAAATRRENTITQSGNDACR